VGGPSGFRSGLRPPSGKGLCTEASTFPRALYVNCDLPGESRRLEEPETFYRSVRESIVIFDEIHQLPDPSRLLKIGADAFPGLQILATGSSTLGATRKFRDALTGRKRSLTLSPILVEELSAFGSGDLNKRLFRGGLPPVLLNDGIDDGFYAEWMDSYYARDVQELFRVEKRGAFLRLMELLLRQSGGMVEPTSLARDCGLSRPTVLSYIDAMQITHVVRMLRPYHGESARELVHQPKVYAFDTGFVRFAKGWNDLRPEDCGLLWEHVALDALLFHVGSHAIHYWRDKQGREVDFVIPRGRGEADAVECKWTPTAFDPKGVIAFRALHPKGRNVVLSPAIQKPFSRSYGPLTVEFLPLAAFHPPAPLG